LDRIQARRIAADGTLGSVKSLSATNEQADRHRVRMDTFGNATVVWELGDDDYEDTSIQARTVAPDATLGPVQTLSGAVDANSPDLVVDPNDLVTVVWETSDIGIQYAKS
jgi:hypothetical protein